MGPTGHMGGYSRVFRFLVCFFFSYSIFFIFSLGASSRQEERAHPVDQLSDHASPGAVGLRRPVQAVIHQLDLKGELQDVGQLPQHVDAETLILVVSLEVLVVVFAHHVWVLLSVWWGEEVSTRDSDTNLWIWHQETRRFCSIYVENILCQ